MPTTDSNEPKTVSNAYECSDCDNGWCTKHNVSGGR